MTKKQELDLEEILEFIQAAAAGVNIEFIHQHLPIRLSRRTLQRRLAELVGEGAIQQEGRGAAVQYHENERSMVASKIVPSLIALSPASLKLRQRLSQPLKKRKAVAYKFDFLNNYVANKSSYLSESILEHLHSIGRAPRPEPLGSYAKQIFNHLLIDLSWNSSRLEGNTYSLLQTEQLLQNGIVAEGKDKKETQMLLNHKAALEFLLNNVEAIRFNSYTILNLHSMLSNNLLDPRMSGRIRNIPVGISHSTYTPLAIPQQIESCFQQILKTASQIKNPFECAFFVMVHLPYLQPFEDVNKRVSRLSANIPLIINNFCPLSFVDVAEPDYIGAMLAVYELNRIDYLRDVFVWAYERSCARYSQIQTLLGEPDPFRMLYSELIQTTIYAVITAPMDKLQADRFIYKVAAKELKKADEARFIEVVETELMFLHEGNSARYQVSLSDFLKWNKGWI